MEYSYRNELYHYGIKGQKWGVRRFQNPDGSLTAAGKKRYDSTLEKAKALADITAELERRTRFYNEGMSKDSKMLVSSDELKEYKRLYDDFTKSTSILNKQFSFISNDVKSMDDGYDYVRTLIRDDKLGAYLEYMALIGKTK